MSRGTWLTTAAAGIALAGTVAWCGVEPPPPKQVLADALCQAIPGDQVAPLLATDATALMVEPGPQVPWSQSVWCDLNDRDGEHRGFVAVSSGGLPVSRLIPIYQENVADSRAKDPSQRNAVVPLAVQGREAYFVVVDDPDGHRNRSLTIQVDQDATLQVLLTMSDEQRGDYTDPAPLIPIIETLLPRLES